MNPRIKPAQLSGIPSSSLYEQRLKGARLMVYFRWIFILMLLSLVSFQYISGYRHESMHGFRLITLYTVCNIFLWRAALRRYDPPWVGYLSVLMDTFIVIFHLWYLTSFFDFMAVSSAATTFLIPVLFILYTFRNDHRLMIFIILLSLTGFNAIYFYHYHQQPDMYHISLSITPLSQFFKTIYILFIGVLCIYLQFSLKGFIDRQLEITRQQAESDSLVRIEKEKGFHAIRLKEQAEEQNRLLAMEIREKEKVANDLKRSRLQLESINQTLEETIEERTKALTQANTRLLKLEKENLQSQFDMLKQQVNPHFLFNSLNVLTSLIQIDPMLAETFTERLAKVYRYVLENKDKDLITLATEMNFLNAYLFLIKTRFEDKVIVDIQLTVNPEEVLVVPLALQLLIENAIKHNTFSKRHPLRISIALRQDGYLTVENNLQPRTAQLPSTGVGLNNITKRYALLTDKPTRFETTETSFIATIPLMDKVTRRTPNDENSHY